MESLTRHALTRMQQRGIPQAALECLLDYGRLQCDHRGAAIVFLDKAARRRLAREQGDAPLKQPEKHLDALVNMLGHANLRVELKVKHAPLRTAA